MARLILDQVRRRKRVSKRQLAIRMGMRYENVFRIFRPGYDAKFSVLQKIAKALKCKVRDLIKEH